MLLYYSWIIKKQNDFYNMSKGKCLKDYIYDHIIDIPCYQRGYVWGKTHEGSKDSVSFMLDTLLVGYGTDETKEQNKKDIFVQGITVVQSKNGTDNTYIVIDGQQRTTFFFLLLKTLGDDKKISIIYNSSRGATTTDVSPQLWLNNFSLDTDCTENLNEPTQDVYFFKKTVRLIKEHDIFKVDHEKLIAYIRKHVRFLLIPISASFAVSTFTMMNGNKAIMADYELIKADLLRRASLGTGGYSNSTAREWDNISLRSRYAHEWDKWLHWWKQDEVQKMFYCTNPMGWLLKTVFDVSKVDEDLFPSYKNYINKMEKESLNCNNPAQAAKLLFAELRACQHKFEDTYADSIKYNQFGVILRFLNNDERIKFIKNYFFNSKNHDVLKDLTLLYNLLLMGYTYNQISKMQLPKEKVNEFESSLIEGEIYGVNNELAYRYLLVRNVERDSELNRKFDFSVWGNRSLEHVYPKSKVVHEGQDGLMGGHGELIKELGDYFIDDRGLLELKNPTKERNIDIESYITQKSIKLAWSEYVKKNANRYEILTDFSSINISEHSIGNLLLLYGNNNSSFGNKMPEEKRQSYFELNKEGIFNSRHLLHTVFSFGRFVKFDQKAICENQKDAIEDVLLRIKNVEPIIMED